MSSQRCLGPNNRFRWGGFLAAGRYGGLALLLGACTAEDGCEARGTCAEPDAAPMLVEAGVLDPTDAAGLTTLDSWDAGQSAVTSHTPATGASDAGNAESSTSAAAPVESNGDAEARACDPVSERGCGGDKPWCLGESDSLMNNLLEAPRCVECERDEDCGADPASTAEEGLCVDYVCMGCEVGTHRGCDEAAPYCIFLGLEIDPADAAAERDSGFVEERALMMQPQCVECMAETDCTADAPACANHACVECDRDEQCSDPGAPLCDTQTNKCVGCTSVGQCARFEDTPACDVNNGVCVSCTRAEQSKCDGQASGGFDAACVTIAVHPDYQTCSDERRGYSSQCNECVSDSQCRAGFRCVAETYTDAGGEAPTGKTYCMALESELEGGKACGDNRPFVGQFEATSEGGVTGVYCRPAYTTCAGYADWRSGPDTVSDGDSGTKTTCTSDESCGLPGIDDAYCVEFTATANRCTYACSSEDDCPLPDSWCDMSNPPPGFSGACSVEPN